MDRLNQTHLRILADAGYGTHTPTSTIKESIFEIPAGVRFRRRIAIGRLAGLKIKRTADQR